MPKNKFSKELLECTIQIWSKRKGAPISKFEAEEILTNTCALFSYLNDLDEKHEKEKKEIQPTTH